jgi:hypothetical protein
MSGFHEETKKGNAKVPLDVEMPDFVWRRKFKKYQ